MPACLVLHSLIKRNIFMHYMKSSLLQSIPSFLLLRNVPETWIPTSTWCPMELTNHTETPGKDAWIFAFSVTWLLGNDLGDRKTVRMFGGPWAVDLLLHVRSSAFLVCLRLYGIHPFYLVTDIFLLSPLLPISQWCSWYKGQTQESMHILFITMKASAMFLKLTSTGNCFQKDQSHLN